MTHPTDAVPATYCEAALGKWLKCGSSSYRHPVYEIVGSRLLKPAGITYSYFTYDATGSVEGFSSEISFISPVFDASVFRKTSEVGIALARVFAAASQIELFIHDGFFLEISPLPSHANNQELLDLLNEPVSGREENLAAVLNIQIATAIQGAKYALDSCVWSLLSGEETFGKLYLQDQQAFLAKVVDALKQ